MDIPTCSKCFRYRLSRETFISITYAKLNIYYASIICVNNQVVEHVRIYQKTREKSLVRKLISNE
jgi:hypothetical protein